jgi:protocadherin-15
VKAEDPGKLSTTATVNIKVTDINDKNPEFLQSELPYVFSVKEGLSNVSIGRVHAIDLDEGVNSQVSYSLPSDIPFAINNHTGEIKTKMALDYENKKVY